MFTSRTSQIENIELSTTRAFHLYFKQSSALGCLRATHFFSFRSREVFSKLKRNRTSGACDCLINLHLHGKSGAKLNENYHQRIGTGELQAVMTSADMLLLHRGPRKDCFQFLHESCILVCISVITTSIF